MNKYTDKQPRTGSTTLALFLLGLLLAGCTDSGLDIGTVLGPFQYTAFDSSNAVVERGSIVLGKSEWADLLVAGHLQKAAAASWLEC